VPADAKALIIAPNLGVGPLRSVRARLHRRRGGWPTVQKSAWTARRFRSNGTRVKEQLTQLSTQLGPQQGSMQGPLAAFVNQAADTFDGNGALVPAGAARALADRRAVWVNSRTDLFGTIRNLQVLVNALCRTATNRFVQFSSHVGRRLSQVLADSSTDLDNTLGTLNQALSDVKGFPEPEQSGADRPGLSSLSQFTQILTDHSDDIEADPAHHAPTGLANFYNIYNPAQGTVGGSADAAQLRQSRPVRLRRPRSMVGASPDNYKRAEICRQRMGPVFKRITMNYPPILFHPINSITAYKGQIMYDTPDTEAKAQTPGAVSAVAERARGDAAAGTARDADLTSLMVPPAPQGTPGQPAPGSDERRTPGARRAVPADPNAPAPTAPLPAEGAGG